MNNDELAGKLDAIRNGDRIAFEELYIDLRTPIFTVINRITWDKAVSEDILQEFFVKLFLSPPTPHNNLRAYIFQIARNLAIDNVRKQTQKISLDDISEIAHRPLEDFQLKMDIDDALKSIPTQECEIVTLHIIGGLTFREIAEVLGIPSGTAKWKYQKAISRLQIIIQGEDVK